MTNDSYIRDRLAHARRHSIDARDTLSTSGEFGPIVDTIDSARDFINAAQERASPELPLADFLHFVEWALERLEDAAKELSDVRDTGSEGNLSQAIGALKKVLGSTEGT